MSRVPQKRLLSKCGILGGNDPLRSNNGGIHCLCEITETSLLTIASVRGILLLYSNVLLYVQHRSMPSILHTLGKRFNPRLIGPRNGRVWAKDANVTVTATLRAITWFLLRVPGVYPMSGISPVYPQCRCRKSSIMKAGYPSRCQWRTAAKDSRTR